MTIVSCANDKCSVQNNTPNNAVTTNIKDSSSVNVPEIDSKIEVKEELPPLKTCSSDIGRVKSNLDHSIGTVTEFTELLKQLRNKNCDIIEITWVSLSPPQRNYEPMPLKLIYNRVNGTLRNIFLESNVIEDYENISEKCLTDFLKSGKKDFYAISDFCQNSTYEFNNREMKPSPIGPKPEQSELDGSVKIVQDYVKSMARNPSRVVFIEWTKVIPFGADWTVRCKFSGINSSGIVETKYTWFYIRNNKVVDTKTIE